MVEFHHLFVALYAGTAVLALTLASAAWLRRTARGALPLATLMLGIAIWAGAAAAMWYSPTIGEQTFWLKVTFLGVWMVPLAVMLLALDIARMRRRRTLTIALLSAVSFAFIGIAWLNPGRLYEREFIAHTIGSFTRYEAVPGPLYDAYNVFAFATIITGLAILLRVHLRSSGAERTQAAILFAGGLVPLVASAATESTLVPVIGLDLAPLAFLITGTLWMGAILQGALLDVLPLARDALVEQMADGVVVLDDEGIVVDANPAARTMLHRTATGMLGSPAETIFSGLEDATATLGGAVPRHGGLKLDSDGDPHYLEVGVTPLVVDPGDPPAHLVTLHDVTEKRRAFERLELARMVFDTANEGIMVTMIGADQPVIEVNDAFCRLTGRSKEDVIGRANRCLRSDVHPPEFYEAIEHALLTEGEWTGEVWQTRADGTAFPSWLSFSVVKDDCEHARYTVGIFTDLTAVREAERVSESEVLYRALANLTPDFVFVIDGYKRVRFPNSAAARFTARPIEQLKGIRVAELFGPLAARFEQRLSKVAATGQPLDVEDRIPVGDSEIWLKSSLVSLAAVAPGLVLGVSRDITDSKRLELVLISHAAQVEHLATHDSLTGIQNRRAFLGALEHALALARRGTSSTVLYMDIDGFKNCNDRRGHPFGDEVLISIARLLEAEAREVDIVARVGGDEFAALLADSTLAEATVVAERMRTGVEALGDEVGIPMSLSVGAVSVDATASIDYVMSTADQRMYENKAGNRPGREVGETT